ncbi:hypothetical protein ABTF26_21900, partial [Acinetobacter baumannii]
SAVFSALAAWSVSASAQTADTTATPATATQPALQPIVVTATPFASQEDVQVLTPAKVIAGDELRNKLGNSLGDTLSS